MKYQAFPLSSDHVFFVDYVFEQNAEILHGGHISRDEWYACLCTEPEPYEMNFIITANGENAAWLKLNALDSEDICISMLVVAKEYQHKGVGSFCIRFAEKLAREQAKNSIRIQTTKDNITATNFYLKHGYRIDKEIRYAVGDGIVRDGYQFIKDLEL